ncbi:MAG: hypothetical protein MJ247_05645 [Alphaproteobacteria bacterium]|nr:hypothetical protein [Alphaproteobacteria bacterium]
MKKKLFLLGFVFLLFGCANSHEQALKMIDFVDNGNYEAAKNIAINEDFYDDKKDRFLKAFDVGLAYYLNNDFEKALEAFQKAKDFSLELRTASASKKIGKQVVGLSIDDYSGAKYEVSLVRFFIALTVMQLHQLDEENEKYSEGLNATLKDWDAFVNNAEEAYMDMLQKAWVSVIQPEKRKQIYASMRRIFDNAYSNLDSFKNNDHIRAFKNFIELKENEPEPNLYIVLRQGTVAKKISTQEKLPKSITNDLFYRELFGVGGGMLDMEKIEKPKVAPKFKLNIKKNGKIIFKKDMALISPVSELAYKQFMDGYGARLSAKIARVVPKYVTAIAVASAAAGKNRDCMICARLAFDLSVSAWSLTEKADLRYVEIMPSNIYLQRFDIKKDGEYEIEISHNENVVATKKVLAKKDGTIVLDFYVPEKLSR